jgi:selenocysteine lyase/cysteine desulfurase
MEAQPLRFIDRQLLPLLVFTVRRLAKLLRVHPKELVLVPNATTALNSVFRSLKLQPGDRILTLDTGYGATKKMLSYVCSASGAVVDELPVVFPVSGDDEVVSLVRSYLRKLKRSGELSRVKLAVFDMVCSNSALVLPVQRLCELCTEMGVDTFVDGAHTLGSHPLDVSALGCCYFTANAHKWLCSAKGAAVLYVRADRVEGVVPAVISHGHGGGSLLSEFVWQGLMDYGPWLSLHTAIDFWTKTGWNRLRAQLHGLVRQGAALLMERWNSDALADESMFGTMWCVRVSGPRVPRSGREAVELQDALYAQRIEVPVKHLQNRLYVRVSAHIYNTIEDFERLAEAVLALRPALWGEEDDADRVAAEDAALVLQEGGCG